MSGLTVAIPTIGRPTLVRTLFSFIGQLHDGDNVIVVADPKGDPDYARFVYELGTNRLGVAWHFDIAGGAGGWGQPQRNHAYDLARLAAPDSHVWCLADDDVATPRALDAIRAAVAAERNSWFVFKAGRGVEEPWVWATPEIRVGNLDADCLVAPAGVESRWGLGYEGDHDFARALQDEIGGPWWETKIVAVTRPSAEYLADHYTRMALGANDSGRSPVVPSEGARGDAGSGAGRQAPHPAPDTSRRFS